MLSDNFISGGLKCCCLLQQCRKNHTIYSVEGKAIRSDVGMKRLKVNYSPLNTPLCSVCCKENAYYQCEKQCLWIKGKVQLVWLCFHPNGINMCSQPYVRNSKEFSKFHSPVPLDEENTDHLSIAEAVMIWFNTITTHPTPNSCVRSQFSHNNDFKESKYVKDILSFLFNNSYAKSIPLEWNLSSYLYCNLWESLLVFDINILQVYQDTEANTLLEPGTKCCVFSFSVSNLLSVVFSVFLISNVVVFIFISSIWVFSISSTSLLRAQDENDTREVLRAQILRRHLLSKPGFYVLDHIFNILIFKILVG